MPPLTEAQKRAKAKYNSKVTKVSIELYPSDTDIIQKLQEQPSKQGYIKDLIRKDLKERSFSLFPSFIEFPAIVI